MPVTTSPAPPATTDPPSSPPTLEETTAPPGTDEPEASTSSGDPLFPELGSADLDVQTYDVRLAYDPDERLLEGTVAISTLVGRPLEELALDATNVSVDAVTVDGAAATFERTDTELIIHPAAAVGPDAPVALVVTYHDDEHASAVGVRPRRRLVPDRLPGRSRSTSPTGRARGCRATTTRRTRRRGASR